MRALDLFSGACGGWSLGLHRAGIETMAACESDPWRRQAFHSNFPQVRMYDDVRSLTATRLVADLGELPDIIVGSPPCQDASSANHRGKGVDGARTGLFFEAVRLVDECRPVWACFENVPGLRARGVDRVLAGLEALGYACWPLVVGAVHAGAPHRRNRVWIVAVAAERVGRQRDFALGQGCGTGSGGWAGAHENQSCAGARADAHGQGQHALAGDAAAVAGLASHGGTAADAGGELLRQQPRRCGGSDGAGSAISGQHGAAGDAADADQVGRGRWGQGLRDLRPGQPDAEGSGGSHGHPPHTQRPRLEVLGGEPGDAGAEQPASERDGAGLWDSWNGGFAARAGRMDDGLPRGMARASLAAFGDAVVPALTEAIARTMLRLVP